MSKMVMLCAICNVSSGNCAEDCAYCTQSAHIKADIPKFKQKNLEQILNEAKIASKNHALGFCLVTSGLGLDDKKLEFICEAATMLRKETPNLMLIACNGSASYESLKELKKVGIFSYNHNLETSREFFPQICTTHSWDDRFNTNLNAKKAGLELCCGGIYGLGESLDDRLSFRASLKELNPFSSPINFFIPNSALKIKQPLLSTDEALGIIRDTAKTLPQCRIMVAGGREVVLGDRQYEILENGASAIVIGDYLTTSGEVASRDIEELRKRGFEFASQCH
ncbi:biotin synthase [Campylobacter fetus]|uniref:biotin synthase n=1 Tax=Campylobacter fetus TaxID=196 RepID=UPI0003C268A1|nr:biotin synthase [Campylobacter fetus]AGZ81075.1 biotin synthetase [Campylobacter fetus subsp. testudinum 03-427]EAI4322811.1 biotin synthase [Campylobacter fetus]EAI4392054.1 biotin synthase [Campylobacter fetus]UEA65218.1 biotin synthase [Campylobacter fetus subsp. testudinum]